MRCNARTLPLGWNEVCGGAYFMRANAVESDRGAELTLISPAGTLRRLACPVGTTRHADRHDTEAQAQGSQEAKGSLARVARRQPPSSAAQRRTQQDR